MKERKYIVKTNNNILKNLIEDGGYAKNKAKFDSNKQLLDKYNNLSEEDKKLVDILKTKNIDELKEFSVRLR